MCFGNVRVTVVPRDLPPAEIEAIAIEDDTYFVLGADPEFREPSEHPIRIWTQVHEAEPAPPGSLDVLAGRPLRLRAVVHDLSRDPSWREEWVAQALDAILDEIARRGLERLGLQPLGCLHGRLSVDRFVALLGDALRRRGSTSLERVWLLVPAEWVGAVERRLEGDGGGDG